MHHKAQSLNIHGPFNITHDVASLKIRSIHLFIYLWIALAYPLAEQILALSEQNSTEQLSLHSSVDGLEVGVGVVVVVALSALAVVAVFSVVLLEVVVVVVVAFSVLLLLGFVVFN